MMRGDVDVRVVYSRDQQARSEVRRWEQVAEAAPAWRPWVRRKAAARAAEARERAVSAGIDWSIVPRPPEGLRAPDRSRRPGGGVGAPPSDWRPSPPPQSSGSGQPALSGLSLAMHVATAPVASARAAGSERGEPEGEAPPPHGERQTRTTESKPSPEPDDGGGGDGTATTMPSDTSGAAAPPATPPPATPPPATPPPVAAVPAMPPPAPPPVTSIPTTAAAAPATSGGGVGLAYGSADVGSLTALSAVEWLDTGPQPVYTDPGVGGFLEAPDGGLWYQDAAGLAYALGPDGAYYALGADGYLYGQMPDGGYFTWTEDGTCLLPDEQGLLWASTDEGDPMVLGEDGLYYTPDTWGEAAAAWQTPGLPAMPETEPPAEEPAITTEPPPEQAWVADDPPPEHVSPATEFADYAGQPGVIEAGPTPGLGDLGPDALWSLDDGEPATMPDDADPSGLSAFSDPFTEPEPLMSENWDEEAATEPSIEESLSPDDDPPALIDDDMDACVGDAAEDQDVEGSSDAEFDQSYYEPPLEPPSPGWTDGSFDI
jgi:hypothetical protein